MRERAKNDIGFQERLLAFATSVARHTTPPNVAEGEDPTEAVGNRVFRPLLSINDVNFDIEFALDLSDLVGTRQIHDRQHNATCFKYGKKCRARYPRALVAEDSIDAETGTCVLKRDDSYLVGYNPLLSVITRANHDCQFLNTVSNGLDKIYYIIKYICKAETSLHSKLTLLAATVKSMQTGDSSNFGRTLLTKTLNRTQSQREVGMPEAVWNLLQYPDHLTDCHFATLNTTKLMEYVKAMESMDGDSIMVNGNIVGTDEGFKMSSVFDDYAYRPEAWKDMNAFDYFSVVYKQNQPGGVPFLEAHPLHGRFSQFVRRDSKTIPTLYGKLVKWRQDEDEREEDGYCMLASLFLPWSRNNPLRRDGLTWKAFFENKEGNMEGRTIEYIANLRMLHKSAEEARLDVIRQRLEEMDEGEGDGESDTIVDGDMDGLRSEDVEMAFEENGDDWYATEATAIVADIVESAGPIPDLLLSRISVRTIGKDSEQSNETDSGTANDEDREPFVYVNYAAGKEAIKRFIERWKLNEKQARAFTTIANHSLGYGLNGDRSMTVGILGQGGTGKSHLIDAIRDWFKEIGRNKELVVSATTGAAAVNIRGSTLHAATGIAVEDGESTKVRPVTESDELSWVPKRYLIIDEISLLDRKVMCQLDARLRSLKRRPNERFGGMNILFFGDFLQMPACSGLNLYENGGDKP
jgi:PIF1-like helicase